MRPLKSLELDFFFIATAAFTPPCPCPHTQTHKAIYPQRFTNILSALLHPPRPEWQGQGSRDDNMAAVISSTAVPRFRAAQKRSSFPKGTWPVSEGGLCWPIRELLKPGSTTCSGHAAPLLLTDNRGGERHEQATHHLHPDTVVECVRGRRQGWEGYKHRGDERESVTQSAGKKFGKLCKKNFLKKNLLDK